MGVSPTKESRAGHGQKGQASSRQGTLKEGLGLRDEGSHIVHDPFGRSLAGGALPMGQAPTYTEHEHDVLCPIRMI